MGERVSEEVLQEMVVYYKERAREYDEWFYRQGRFDRGASANARWFAEADEVVAALQAFKLEGDLLELAPGTGIWTERLVSTATSITAVDASTEMIAINKARVGNEQVSYIQADLFSWQPARSYDGVFFGFWLSHVPLERLDAFLLSVAHMLRPGGKLFFVDSRREPFGTAEEHILPSAGKQIMRRKLNNGRSFAVVKNFFDPVELAACLLRAGLEIEVCETGSYFLYGYGTRCA